MPRQRLLYSLPHGGRLRHSLSGCMERCIRLTHSSLGLDLCGLLQCSSAPQSGFSLLIDDSSCSRWGWAPPGWFLHCARSSRRDPRWSCRPCTWTRCPSSSRRPLTCCPSSSTFGILRDCRSPRCHGWRFARFLPGHVLRPMHARGFIAHVHVDFPFMRHGELRSRFGNPSDCPTDALPRLNGRRSKFSHPQHNEKFRPGAPMAIPPFESVLSHLESSIRFPRTSLPILA